jgi:hypothetical protein
MAVDAACKARIETSLDIFRVPALAARIVIISIFALGWDERNLIVGGGFQFSRLEIF